MLIAGSVGDSVDVVMDTPIDQQVGGVGDERNVSVELPAMKLYRLRLSLRALEASANFFDKWYDEGCVSDNEEIIPKEKDPLCPTIVLTRAEKVRMKNPWKKTLIIKMMGESVGYNYLLRRIRMLWRPSEDMELVAMDNDYFLVKFESMQNYSYAKYEGPWMILEHYLIVKEWVPNFDPFIDQLKDVLVWVRFPCLPIEYYNVDFFMNLGKKIERLIKVDYATSMMTRGKFARLCVEVDLSMPLLPKFCLRKKVRRIEYEGLYLVCFKCGVYGHREESCGVGARGNEHVGGEYGDHYPEENQNFGLWMLASKKNKRNFKNTGKKIEKGISDMEGVRGNNSFGALENLEADRSAG